MQLVFLFCQLKILLQVYYLLLQLYYIAFVFVVTLSEFFYLLFVLFDLYSVFDLFFFVKFGQLINLFLHKVIPNVWHTASLRHPGFSYHTFPALIIPFTIINTSSFLIRYIIHTPSLISHIIKTLPFLQYFALNFLNRQPIKIKKLIITLTQRSVIYSTTIVFHHIVKSVPLLSIDLYFRLFVMNWQVGLVFVQCYWLLRDQ